MKKIKIILNQPCPCTSGEKYKKCCMGKLSEDKEEYFGFLQYTNKITGKLIRWFFVDLDNSEQDYYAKEFGVKNAGIIAKKENPAEFFEWMFYQAKDRDTNEPILKTIIERYAYLFEPDELLILRERVKNSQSGVFEVLSSDEKSWKMVLKEAVTGNSYEVMDRLGSLDSAIGDILLTRVEKIFSKYYLCGFGLMIPRRASAELLSFIKNKYEEQKKRNTSLEYREFMNSNLKEIMAFKPQPIKLIAGNGEELKLCEGKFSINEEDVELLMDYFHNSKEFEIIEANYKKRVANIIFKNNRVKSDKAKNTQTQSITSFAISTDGDKIEYSGSIDINKDKLNIFSQSEKTYISLVERLNKITSKRLVLIKETIESAEKILNNKKIKETSNTEKNDIQNRIAEAFLKDYYAKWCGEKIPALNNNTPKDAVKTEEGKKLLKEMLSDIKNQDEHKRKSEGINFSAEKFIRDELKFYD